MKWYLLLLAPLVLWSCQASESDPSQAALNGEGRSAAMDEDDEEDIPLADVPSNVLAAAEKAVPGIVFESAERETEDGRLVYGLEGLLNGVRHEVEVAADGTVIEVEQGEEDDDVDGDDDEEEIPLGDLPDVVRQAAENAVPGLVISKAYRETEDGGLVYEVVGEVNGERHEVEVSPSGDVLEIEKGDDEDDDDDDEDDDD